MSADRWPGVDKERLYFRSISIKYGKIESDLALQDETTREALIAKHMLALEPMEREAIVQFKVDLMGTADERDEMRNAT